MARKKADPYCRATRPFVRNGRKEFIEVPDGHTVRRSVWHSKKPVEEIDCPITRSGCYIEEIAVSPSGTWAVTQRISGQGEWGYDVFCTAPLAREARVDQEDGYILELPRFSADESRVVGGAGSGFLGGWWAHPDDDIDVPARGGVVSIGFLFVHRLPAHRVTRHELKVKIPKGWLPDDPWNGWYGPQDITPTKKGVRMMPSWGVPVELADPLPRVIRLPTPRPSGKGLL